MCDALQLNWKLTSGAGGGAVAAGGGQQGRAIKVRREKSQQKTRLKETTSGRKAQPKKRGPKPRPKSAPMSKYRRKTANLRERQRMGEINNAFERLRDRIPNPVLAGRGRCEKLTKINILHVTINYIRAMENLLSTGDSGVTSYGEMVRNPIRPNEKPNKFEQFDYEMDEDEETLVARDTGHTTGRGTTKASKAKKKEANGGGTKKSGKKAKERANTAGPQAPLGAGAFQPAIKAPSADTSSDSGLSSSSSSPNLTSARSWSRPPPDDPLLSCNWSSREDDMLKEVVGLVDSLQEDFPELMIFEEDGKQQTSHSVTSSSSSGDPFDWLLPKDL